MSSYVQLDAVGLHLDRYCALVEPAPAAFMQLVVVTIRLAQLVAVAPSWWWRRSLSRDLLMCAYALLSAVQTWRAIRRFGELHDAVASGANAYAVASYMTFRRAT